MKKTNLIKLAALTMIAAQVMTSSVFAGVTMSLTGTVGASSAVDVIADDVAALTLGLATVPATTVGSIQIDSNGTNGFSLSITGTNGFQFRKTTGYAAGTPSTFADLTVSLAASTGGTLGTNVTAPSLTSFSNTVAKSFSAPAGTALPTVAIVYPVQVGVAGKSLQVGSYVETLTFAVATL